MRMLYDSGVNYPSIILLYIDKLRPATGNDVLFGHELIPCQPLPCSAKHINARLRQRHRLGRPLSMRRGLWWFQQILQIPNVNPMSTPKQTTAHCKSPVHKKYRKYSTPFFPPILRLNPYATKSPPWACSNYSCTNYKKANPTETLPKQSCHNVSSSLLST